MPELREPKTGSEELPIGVLLICIITILVVVTLGWSWVWRDLKPKITTCTLMGGEYSVLVGCRDIHGNEIRTK